MSSQCGIYIKMSSKLNVIDKCVEMIFIMCPQRWKVWTHMNNWERENQTRDHMGVMSGLISQTCLVLSYLTGLTEQID